MNKFILSFCFVFFSASSFASGIIGTSAPTLASGDNGKQAVSGGTRASVLGTDNPSMFVSRDNRIVEVSGRCVGNCIDLYGTAKHWSPWLRQGVLESNTYHLISYNPRSTSSRWVYKIHGGEYANSGVLGYYTGVHGAGIVVHFDSSGRGRKMNVPFKAVAPSNPYNINLDFGSTEIRKRNVRVYETHKDTNLNSVINSNRTVQ